MSVPIVAQSLSHYTLISYENAKSFLQGAPYYNVQTVLLALFPYYAGGASGNLSLYARGRDYHQVVTERLSEVAKDHADLFGNATPFTDTSRFDEKALGIFSGLGSLGKNNLLLNKNLGSFCFIGGLLIEKALPEQILPSQSVCTGCNACLKACPTGALSEKGFVSSRCLSHLTQKKQLDSAETDLLRKGSLIWGCDLCQIHCPTNAHVPLCNEPAFCENRLHTIRPTDIDGLSNKAFSAKYGNYAFSWKGPRVLLRNLQVLEQATSQSEFYPL